MLTSICWLYSEWRSASIVTAITALPALLIVVFVFPESPTWLHNKVWSSVLVLILIYRENWRRWSSRKSILLDLLEWSMSRSSTRRSIIPSHSANWFRRKDFSRDWRSSGQCGLQLVFVGTVFLTTLCPVQFLSKVWYRTSLIWID